MFPICSLMVEDKKEGEFLTLSFLEELRHLCFKIGYKFGDFGNELDNLRLSLANQNLHDFQKELVGRLHAVPPGMYASPLRLMAATADIKVSHAAFEAAVRLFSRKLRGELSGND
jgi:hypothetical protein